MVPGTKSIPSGVRIVKQILEECGKGEGERRFHGSEPNVPSRFSEIASVSGPRERYGICTPGNERGAWERASEQGYGKWTSASCAQGSHLSCCRDRPGSLLGSPNGPACVRHGCLLLTSPCRDDQEMALGVDAVEYLPAPLHGRDAAIRNDGATSSCAPSGSSDSASRGGGDRW